MVPGHAVDPPRHRVLLVAAQDHPSRLRLAVDEVVRVAEAGHVVRHLVAGDREQRGMLVVDRRRHDERARHRRDLRAPDSARDDDDVRLDASLLRVDRSHRHAVRHLDAGDPAMREHLGTELARSLSQRICRRVRIEMTVARHPHRAVQRVRRDDRHAARGLSGRHQLDVQANAARAAHAALQLHQLILARCEAQAAHRLEHAELLVQLDAVAAESHHRRRGIELRH